MAAARRLGQRNRLLLVDNNPIVLEQAIRSLSEDGYDASSAVCDVTNPASVDELASRVAAAGPMRILTHVVGLSPNMADWRTIMRVNLVGAALVADRMVHEAGEDCSALVSSLRPVYRRTSCGDAGRTGRTART